MEEVKWNNMRKSVGEYTDFVDVIVSVLIRYHSGVGCVPIGDRLVHGITRLEGDTEEEEETPSA